jgi:hypothetical protein
MRPCKLFDEYCIENDLPTINDVAMHEVTEEQETFTCRRCGKEWSDYDDALQCAVEHLKDDAEDYEDQKQAWACAYQ